MPDNWFEEVEEAVQLVARLLTYGSNDHVTRILAEEWLRRQTSGK